MGILIGAVRKWWVPGWVYDEQSKARSVSDTQAERTAEALDAFVKAFQRQATELASLRRILTEKRPDG